jgi:protein SCO1/2
MINLFKFLGMIFVYIVILSGSIFAEETPSDVIRRVAFHQKLNEQIPLGLTFQDENGKKIQLKEYFGKKPVILALVYYECPMLCTLVLNGLVKSLRVVTFNPGQEFDIVTVSFNPKETPELARVKKEEYLKTYSRPNASEGWHFLTGDESTIQKLTESVGFQYVYDAKLGQYAHASGIIVLTPEGKTARYFYGVEYSPRDLRLALVEASNGKIGSPIDQLILLCYHYDPLTGKYGLTIMKTIRVAGVITVLALGNFIFFMMKRDRRKKQNLNNRQPEAGPPLAENPKF